MKSAGTPAGNRIVAAVANSDGRSRRELAAELGLPLGTVTSVTSSLLKAGHLTEQPLDAPLRPLRGRPPVVLVHPGPVRTLGVVAWSDGRLRADVATYGGRVLRTESFVLDARSAMTDSPELTAALDFAAGRSGAARSGFATPSRVVVSVPAPYQRGVGVPGPVPALPDDTSGRPMFAPWLRTDPAHALSERLGVPVHIENDANLGALGEAHFGAGRDHSESIYIKIADRSIGAGLVLAGNLYRGATGFAGELAHIHLDDDGALCACGSRGCLARRFGQALIDAVQPAYDTPLTFSAIRDLAAAGDTGPIRVLRDLGRTIGRPLADLCTFLNPSAIILDATLGAAGPPLGDGIREQIEMFSAPAAGAAVTVVSGERADADVVGAIYFGRAAALQSAG